MANRTLWNVQSATRALVVLPMQITILGNTTPANGTFSVAEGGESAASVARTGTGAYTVTLRDSFPKDMSVNISIYPHSGAARTVRLDAIDESAKTIKFVVLNASLAAVDTANGETDRVHIIATYKNSTALR